jgi:fibronectin type 3 domain-containing protein
LVSISLYSPLFATIINVPADSSTIQGGINGALNGDTVLVQPGTYFENIIWPDVNGIKLISAGDSSNTVIDGGGVSSVIYMNPAIATIDYSTVVQGFKIANGGNIAYGAGIYINSADPVVTQLWIADNTATNCGGGFYIHSSSPMLTQITVSDNSADSEGGGICIREGNPLLSNLTVSGNMAFNGGGIYISGASPTLTNLDMTNNTAAEGGGGIYISGGNPIISQLSVYDNIARHYGGGINVNSGSPTLADMFVTGNTADNGGGLWVSGSPALVDVIVADNKAYTEGGGLHIFFGSPTLNDVTVISNIAAHGGGLYILSSAPILTDVTVASNTASHKGGGLCIYFSDPIITRITVSQNIGAGLFFGGISNVVLTNATITGNTCGIYIEKGTPIISGSNFSYQGVGLHNNDNSNIINATGNWWGHSSGPHHLTQNPSGLGDSVNAFVNVIPWLTEPDTTAPPMPIQNLMVTGVGIDNVELSWDAGEISDLAGYRVYWDTDTSGYPYSSFMQLGKQTSYTLTGLLPVVETFISVTCYDSDGNESWYSQDVVITLDPTPWITITPDSIKFDSTVCRDTTSKTLSISNMGTEELAISGFSSNNGQFHISHDSVSILPSEQVEVIVSFIPLSYGEIVGTLTISSNAENEPILKIPMIGFGELDTLPRIVSIEDIPDDQGGQIRLLWYPSRFIKEGRIIMHALFQQNEEGTWTLVNENLGGWRAPGPMSAIVPTFADSNLYGLGWSHFQIVAWETVNPAIYYMSPIDSGYSIDNLAPQTPSVVVAASPALGIVMLSWNYEDIANDLQHFLVYRATTTGFDPSGVEPIAHTSELAYADSGLTGGLEYYYRISALDVNGNESEYSDEVSAIVVDIDELKQIPDEFKLHQAYPNPFNPVSTIRYNIPQSSDVSLIVYDMLGREVERLAEGYIEPGYHKVQWDGRNAGGREVPSGIYIARLVTPGYSKSIKMVLLK